MRRIGSTRVKLPKNDVSFVSLRLKMSCARLRLEGAIILTFEEIPYLLDFKYGLSHRFLSQVRSILVQFSLANLMLSHGVLIAD